MTDYTGDSGDNIQVGSADDDHFYYDQGGHDTLDGGYGDDSFYMGAALDPLDVINGGDPDSEGSSDTVYISGDYSAGLTISSSMLLNIEFLGLGAGDYRLQIGDGIGVAGADFSIGLASGATGTVDASALTTTVVYFSVLDGVADVRLIGTGGDDVFQLDAEDRQNVLIGGGGADRAQLELTGAFKAAGHSFNGIETIQLIDNFRLTLADGNAAAGQTLAITGWVADNMNVDGHKETDGHYQMTGNDQADWLVGGHLADTLDGGASNDTLIGGGGADQLTGGAGDDTFVFLLAGQSLVAAPDLITDLEAGDLIDLSAIDADKKQAGVQHFTLVEAFDGHAGELTLSYDAGADVTRLLGDLKGTGRPQMEIDISGDHTDFTGLVLGGG